MTVAQVPCTRAQVLLERPDHALDDLVGIRAKPEVEPRATGSSTRSGWAQNDISVQSGVSRETSTISVTTVPR